MAPDGQSMVVFGGGDETVAFGTPLDDLYSVALSTGAWTQLHPGGEDAPAGRLFAGLAHLGDAVLLFGGLDGEALGERNDLWRFDLDAGTWAVVHAGDLADQPATGFCAFPPDFTAVDLVAPERRRAPVVTPGPDGTLLVYGGISPCGPLDDVWSWDPGTAAWTERVAASTGETCPRRDTGPCTSICD